MPQRKSFSGARAKLKPPVPKRRSSNSSSRSEDLRVVSNISAGVDVRLQRINVFPPSPEKTALIQSLELASGAGVSDLWGRERTIAPARLRSLTADGSDPWVEVFPDLKVRMLYAEARDAALSRAETCISVLLGIPLPEPLRKEPSEDLQLADLHGCRRTLEAFWSDSRREYDYELLRWLADRTDALLQRSAVALKTTGRSRAEFLKQHLPTFNAALATASRFSSHGRISAHLRPEGTFTFGYLRRTASTGGSTTADLGLGGHRWTSLVVVLSSLLSVPEGQVGVVVPDDRASSPEAVSALVGKCVRYPYTLLL